MFLMVFLERSTLEAADSCAESEVCKVREHRINSKALKHLPSNYVDHLKVRPEATSR